MGNPISGPIFADGAGKPLDLEILTRIIAAGCEHHQRRRESSGKADTDSGAASLAILNEAVKSVSMPEHSDQFLSTEEYSALLPSLLAHIVLIAEHDDCDARNGMGHDRNRAPVPCASNCQAICFSAEKPPCASSLPPA